MIRQKGLDKDARRMPLSGAFPHLKADIYTSLPIHFECKNQERLQVWKWWDELNAKTKFGKESALVITSNNRPIIVTISGEYYLNLLKIEQQYFEELKNG